MTATHTNELPRNGEATAFVGAYVINHVNSNMRYVGSSGNLRRRMADHRFRLKKGIHECEMLQHLFNNDPILKITYWITTDRDAAFDLEQRLLDEAFLQGQALNIGKDVRKSMLGLKHSRETKVKIGIPQKGISILTGPQTEKHRAAISQSLRGRSLTDKHRTNISNGLLKRDLTPELRHKFSLAALKRNEPAQRKIEINNVTYPSVTIAARELGFKQPTLHYRVNSTNPKWVDYRYAVES